MSLLLLKIFTDLLLNILTDNSEYVFTIQRTIHTTKGDDSICIFFRVMPLFQLRSFILYQAPHSRALTDVCGVFVLISGGEFEHRTCRSSK